KLQHLLTPSLTIPPAARLCVVQRKSSRGQTVIACVFAGVSHTFPCSSYPTQHHLTIHRCYEPLHLPPILVFVPPLVPRQHHTIQRQHHNQATSAFPVVVILCFSIFIILENLLVLVAVISRICRSRRWVYVCIANITLSDLLTGAAYLVNICMSGSQTFRLSSALWLFREGMLFVALAASIFSLLLIAVERYTTMMKPLPQKSANKTYCRIYGLVALCWVLALVIGFLPLLGWNCVCSLDACSTLLPLYSKSYIFFSSSSSSSSCWLSACCTVPSTATFTGVHVWALSAVANAPWCALLFSADLCISLA
ncbi:hypothetical protein KUCAC02_020499, partial [Chaenocephalus aceratus]